MLNQKMIDEAVEQSIDKAEIIANYILQQYKEENNLTSNSEIHYGWGTYTLIGIAGMMVVVATVISCRKCNTENHIKTSATEYNIVPMHDMTNGHSEDMPPIGEHSVLIP